VAPFPVLPSLQDAAKLESKKNRPTSTHPLLNFFSTEQEVDTSPIINFLVDRIYDPGIMKKIQGMFFDGRISELQEKDNVISPTEKM
jgi:hypothetical protein